MDVAGRDAVILLIANFLIIHVIVKQGRDLDSYQGVWMWIAPIWRLLRFPAREGM